MDAHHDEKKGRYGRSLAANAPAPVHGLSVRLLL
jgi:hypothetical protein